MQTRPSRSKQSNPLFRRRLFIASVAALLAMLIGSPGPHARVDVDRELESRIAQNENGTAADEGESSDSEESAGADGQSDSDGGPTTESLDSMVTPLVDSRMGTMLVPGASIAVVHEGQIILLKGYGNADLGLMREVDAARTQFRVGQISAVVTSMLALQLIERGEVRFTTPVNDLVDIIQLPQRRQTSGEGRGPIVFEDLLTRETTLVEQNDNTGLPSPIERRTLPEYLGDVPEIEVGQAGRLRASDYEVALLGYIIERVAQRPFQEVAERRIFVPSRMRYSTFRPEDIRDRYTATPYLTSTGRYVKMAPYYYSAIPAHSLTISAGDMARLMLILLNDGAYEGRVLRTSSTRAILQRGEERRHMHTVRYGLFKTEFRGKAVLYRESDQAGYAARVVFLPQQNIGIFVACNTYAPNFTRDVANAVLRAYFE